MVLRAEFQAALDAANLVVFNMITVEQDDPQDKPNLQVSLKQEGRPEGWLTRHWRQYFPPGDFADHAPSTKTAVMAAKDLMQRKIVAVLERSALRMECQGIREGAMGANMVLDGQGLSRHNRIGLMSEATWDATREVDMTFREAIPVIGGVYWRDLIWFKAIYLDVRAVVYHKDALRGGIKPYDADPGQSASASVWLRLTDPEYARVLVF